MPVHVSRGAAHAGSTRKVCARDVGARSGKEDVHGPPVECHSNDMFAVDAAVGVVGTRAPCGSVPVGVHLVVDGGVPLAAHTPSSGGNTMHRVVGAVHQCRITHLTGKEESRIVSRDAKSARCPVGTVSERIPPNWVVCSMGIRNGTAQPSVSPSSESGPLAAIVVEPNCQCI